jgi:hypothetical protein
LNLVAAWWRFSRCENQRRVQRRNAFRSVDIFRAPVPPAAVRTEFSQRENCHHSGQGQAALHHRHHSNIERAGRLHHTDRMGKTKIPATGEGFLGEIMVHKLSRAIGTVTHVAEAQAGWPPQLTLKLADGTLKKSRLSDFRDPSGTERSKFAPA